MYRKDFEPPFIQSTEQLYHNEGRQLIQTLEISQYLLHVERRLREEQNRLMYYIDQSTKYENLIVIVREEATIVF